MCGLMTYQEVTGTLPFAGSFVKFGTQGTKSCDLRDLAVEKKIRDPIRFLRNRSLQITHQFDFTAPRVLVYIPMYRFISYLYKPMICLQTSH